MEMVWPCEANTDCVAQYLIGCEFSRTGDVAVRWAS